MRERVQRLLEARVGFGNSVVEVSVDTVTESESLREHRYDPEGRVAISTDTEERSNTSKDAGSGEVTVASNLPDQEGSGGDSSSSNNSETRERINYEVSKTEREIIRAPGAIKRVTVAVLVNEPTSTNDAGQQVPEPRSDEELSALRELVSSAVGYDEGRGDIITIKSMPLQSISPSGTAVGPSILDQFDLDLMSAIQMVVLALVTLILGLFVVKPILSRKQNEESSPVAALPASQQSSQGNADPSALTGEIENDDYDLPDLTGGLNLDDDQGMLPDLPMMGGISDDPVDRLRAMIGERQQETVEILRSWLEDKEENV